MNAEIPSDVADRMVKLHREGYPPEAISIKTGCKVATVKEVLTASQKRRSKSKSSEIEAIKTAIKTAHAQGLTNQEILVLSELKGRTSAYLNHRMSELGLRCNKPPVQPKKNKAKKQRQTMPASALSRSVHEFSVGTAPVRPIDHILIAIRNRFNPAPIDEKNIDGYTVRFLPRQERINLTFDEIMKIQEY